MATLTSTTPATERSAGRRQLWAGLILALLSIVAVVVQIMVLKILVVPWHVPVLASLAALLVLLALAQRLTVTRIVALLLLTALAGFEWLFLVSHARLPDYAGPRAGQPFPAFATTLADGTPFTDRDLASSRTVMSFFRGRW
jgi:hypothetical protein